MSGEDEYEFYPCLVDQAPASIYVNLKFEREAPRADTRYSVELAMREAGSQGIGSAQEAEALDAIEQALVAQLRELVYVGRLRTRGLWEATFYGSAGRAEAVRAAAMARADGRRVTVHAEPDPAWRYYRELLLPDDERRRWMDDRRIVQVLKEQGDMLVTPRRVDHHVAFARQPDRAAFIDAVTHHGFTLARTLDEPDRERPFAAHVWRTDAIELDHIHEVVMALVDAAAAHGGRYERWEAGIEGGAS